MKIQVAQSDRMKKGGYQIVGRNNLEGFRSMLDWDHFI